MFVFSCKTSKKQLAVVGVCAVMLIICVCAAFLRPNATQTVAFPPASTAEEGAAYLKSLGYDVSGGEVREIQLPDTLDATLAAYNELRKTAGVDITPLLGKRVQFRTYTVHNHPSQNATAHLYIYGNRIVAGDLTVDGVPTILTKLKDVTNGTTG